MTTISLLLLILSLCSFGVFLPIWFLYEMIFPQIFSEDDVATLFFGYQRAHCKQQIFLPERKCCCCVDPWFLAETRGLPGYQLGYLPGYQLGYLPGYQLGYLPGYQLGYLPGYQPVGLRK
jgi:hypothetical protein